MRMRAEVGPLDGRALVDRYVLRCEGEVLDTHGLRSGCACGRRSNRDGRCAGNGAREDAGACGGDNNARCASGTSRGSGCHRRSETWLLLIRDHEVSKRSAEITGVLAVLATGVPLHADGSPCSIVGHIPIDKVELVLAFIQAHFEVDLAISTAGAVQSGAPLDKEVAIRRLPLSVSVYARHEGICDSGARIQIIPVREKGVVVVRIGQAGIVGAPRIVDEAQGAVLAYHGVVEPLTVEVVVER